MSNNQEQTAFFLTFLRILLGIIYLWFGILKIINRSPAAPLLANTFPWWDPAIVVPATGCLEVVIGTGFLFPKILRWTFPLFVLQLSGTFLSFIICPQLMFNQNLLLLTTEGEFVSKNLILLTAGCLVYVLTVSTDDGKKV